MIEIRQGFPEYSFRMDTVFIPRPIPEDEDLMDIGVVTAHELGHAFLRHRPGTGGKARIKREVEAWLWAVSKRGLTEQDKEYFYDELLTDALDEGMTSGELADLVSETARKMNVRNY